MPTFDSKEIVDEIIKNEGYYEDDPRVVKVVQYTNNWGGTSYGLVYAMEDRFRYETSPFCHDCKILWEVKDAPDLR